MFVFYHSTSRGFIYKNRFQRTFVPRTAWVAFFLQIHISYDRLLHWVQVLSSIYAGLLVPNANLVLSFLSQHLIL